MRWTKKFSSWKFSIALKWKIKFHSPSSSSSSSVIRKFHSEYFCALFLCSGRIWNLSCCSFLSPSPRWYYMSASRLEKSLPSDFFDFVFIPLCVCTFNRSPCISKATVNSLEKIVKLSNNFFPLEFSDAVEKSWDRKKFSSHNFTRWQINDLLTEDIVENVKSSNHST